MGPKKCRPTHQFCCRFSIKYNRFCSLWELEFKWIRCHQWDDSVCKQSQEEYQGDYDLQIQERKECRCISWTCHWRCYVEKIIKVHWSCSTGSIEAYLCSRFAIQTHRHEIPGASFTCSQAKHCVQLHSKVDHPVYIQLRWKHRRQNFGIQKIIFVWHYKTNQKHNRWKQIWPFN